MSDEYRDKLWSVVLVVAWVALVIIGINYSPAENKDGYSPRLEKKARYLNR